MSIKNASPASKVMRTEKWARTMTKVSIRREHRGGVRWNLVEFLGRKKRESAGIIDMMAVRKDHREHAGFERGDLLDIILIQVKGGSAPNPTPEECRRLLKVKRRYRAREVVLSRWNPRRQRNTVEILVLEGTTWRKPRADIFR